MNKYLATWNIFAKHIYSLEKIGSNLILNNRGVIKEIMVQQDKGHCGRTFNDTDIY